MHRLFRDKKVIFEMPADDEGEGEEGEEGAAVWFNILVLHQGGGERLYNLLRETNPCIAEI